MRTFISIAASVFVSGAALLAADHAAAQGGASEYPNRPVRFVIPYPPGGNTDVFSRLVGNALEPRAIVVQPVPAGGEFTVWSATQIPHFLRVFFTLSRSRRTNRCTIVKKTMIANSIAAMPRSWRRKRRNAERRFICPACAPARWT